MTRYREQLSKLCKRPGYSRYSVGIGAGYNKNYVGEVVKGNITPSIEALEKLADALDVSLAELLFGGDSNEALDEISLRLRDLDPAGMKAVFALVNTLAPAESD